MNELWTVIYFVPHWTIDVGRTAHAGNSTEHSSSFTLVKSLDNKILKGLDQCELCLKSTEGTVSNKVETSSTFYVSWTCLKNVSYYLTGQFIGTTALSAGIIETERL
jgi:hypothetical protein